MVTNICVNCSVLSKQCLELKSEIASLTVKLDKIIGSISCNTNEQYCQTEEKTYSDKFCQTDSTIFLDEYC